MKRTTAKLLHDALSAGREIEQFAAQTTREQFLTDRQRQLVFERLFEIVGMALSKAIQSEPDIQLEIPDAHKIISTRNRIAHEYADVSYPLLWFTATMKVPGMCDTIERILPDIPIAADFD